MMDGGDWGEKQLKSQWLTGINLRHVVLDGVPRNSCRRFPLFARNMIYSGMQTPEWRFRSGKKQVSVRPAGILRADNGEALLQWAVAGLGIVNTPSFLIGGELDDGRLETVLDDYAAPEYGVYIVRPPGAVVPAKVRTLIDNIVNHFISRSNYCSSRQQTMVASV